MNVNNREQGRYFFLTSWPNTTCKIERSLFVSCTSKSTDKNNIWKQNPPAKLALDWEFSRYSFGGKWSERNWYRTAPWKQIQKISSPEKGWFLKRQVAIWPSGEAIETIIEWETFQGFECDQPKIMKLHFRMLQDLVDKTNLSSLKEENEKSCDGEHDIVLLMVGTTQNNGKWLLACWQMDKNYSRISTYLSSLSQLYGKIVLHLFLRLVWDRLHVFWDASHQTWDLSKNLHDRIFGPKVLHTKSV